MVESSRKWRVRQWTTKAAPSSRTPKAAAVYSPSSGLPTLDGVVALNFQRPSTHGMVGEYSRVASATVELPRDLASVLGSIVADATVKTFHAYGGLKPTAKFKAPLRGGERRANG